MLCTIANKLKFNINFPDCHFSCQMALLFHDRPQPENLTDYNLQYKQLDISINA